MTYLVDQALIERPLPLEDVFVKVHGNEGPRQ